MKKILVSMVTIIFILTALVSGAFIYYRSIVSKPLKSDAEKIKVVVEKDDSLYKVLDRLNESGNIKNIQLTKFYYKYSGKNTDLKPGKYSVSSDVSMDGLVSSLSGGNHDTVSITIPEGSNVENIAQIVEKSGLAKKDEFINAVKSYELPSYVPSVKDRRYALEGYLFPDTYSFEKDTSSEKIIKTMLVNFESKMKQALTETGVSLEESKYDEVINKAAMIERETGIDEERANVSSVINNRLAIDMPLQIDATVLYAIGVDSKEVLLKDMAVENPYNTYFVKTLPLGPISNPGLESIKAALKPNNTDYIYYILNPKTNKHFFTNSSDEFSKKKIEYYGEGATP